MWFENVEINKPPRKGDSVCMNTLKYCEKEERFG